jgi:hypothetical protein
MYAKLKALEVSQQQYDEYANKTQIWVKELH